MRNPIGHGEYLLYLDFDGVLHHQNVFWHRNLGVYLSAPDGYVLFQHSALLERLIAPYPDLKIVLSTSWVSRYGNSRAAKNLRPALRARVIGATYNARMDKQSFAAMPRGMQVWEDVRKRQPKDWLALDDDHHQWPEWCRDKYVRTHPLEGLSVPEVIEDFRKKLEIMYMQAAPIA